MTTPSGGYLRWAYASVPLLSGSKSEVQSRYWSTGGGAAEQTYSFSHPNDASNNVHTYTGILDASNTADKAYFWRGDGMLSSLYERTLPSYVSLRTTTPTWTTDAIGHPYISSTSTVVDPGTANAKTSKSDQTIDIYGNVTQMKMYDYADLVNPARTYNYTYLHQTSSQYVPLHIFHRVKTVTVQKNGGSVITLAQNTYDIGNMYQLQAAARQWDSTVTTYRGNVTNSVSPGAIKNVSYYVTGSPFTADDGNGHSVSMTMDASKNSAVPSAVTSGSLTSTFSWNGALGITGSSGPNGATSAYNYDTQARPSQTTSPTGQVVKYEYTTSPSTQLSVADGRWTRTTYDGLGRQSMVETGYKTGAFPSLVRTTVSVVDTMYTPCGCSPLGKVLKVSLPHAPDGTQYWIEYVYDALGRTIQVKQPSSSGTANYLYAGNTVKSTDAAGKWKQFENDALGNLTKVTEPNPAGGTYDTNYTYSELNQLLTVSMPRGAVTQTRTFVYHATTQRLTSTTNPENGTTTNYYNADGTLAYKIDAKLQKISYDYDSLMRVTAVHRFTDGVNEDTMQRTNFEYDANSVVPSFSANVNGRLAVAKSYAMTVTGGTTAITTFYEMYSYDSAGRVLKKRLRVSNNALGDVDKDVEYSFTGAKLDSVKYPDINVPFTYYYDNMLRPNRMTGKDPSDYQNGTNVVDYVNSVNYNVASRMTSTWTLNLGYSTYTYNERNELTRQQTGTLADIQYEYSATSDNGQILSRTNNVSAEKVSYQYDALKRLVAASSPNWGSTYGFDGFGNLLSKTPTAGSAPLLSVTVNGLTNRINSGGFTYDANGNMTSSGTFDIENRLTTAGGESYGYLTNNQRVYKRDASGAEWIYFHDASGKRIMTFQMANAGGTFVVTGGSKNVYFAGRSIILNDTAVVTDRLGSVVSRGGAAVDYFPYGEEKTVTANPAEKFGTYLRDATGLDYANQRYFASATGRFLSSDPYQASGGAGDPGSWNRNAYVLGDPVNYLDPKGLTVCDAKGDHCYDFINVYSGDDPYRANPAGRAPLESQSAGERDIDPAAYISPSWQYYMAKSLRDLVQRGQMNDCNAMGSYLAGMSSNIVSAGGGFGANELISAMNLFIPSENLGASLAKLGTGVIQGVRGPVVLGDSGAQSGYINQFQDWYPNPNNQDQGHHFAFYLMLGYLNPKVANALGGLGGDIVGQIGELLQKSPMNTGDVNLAGAAMQFGARLRGTTTSQGSAISLNNVGSAFNNTFCRK